MPSSSLDPHFDIVAVAASAGGIPALIELLAVLPVSFPLPILVLQHLSAAFASQLPIVLGWRTALAVKWAEDGEQPRPGTVYVGPANEQLTVTAARRLALGPATGFRRGRPTADRLFETVARCYGRTAIGLVLSGVLDDGARGSVALNDAGAVTMAQNEISSDFFDMPAAAIDFGRAQITAAPEKIAAYLRLLGEFPLHAC